MNNQEPNHEPNDSERLRSEILGLTSVLQILEHQLGDPISHVPSKKHETVDDILIHITNLLNTGSPPKLVVAVSGSPRTILDLTLTVVTRDGPDTSLGEGQGMWRSPSRHPCSVRTSGM